MNDLLVLSALSNGEQYGLGIIREVEDSGIKLFLGGLYTILRRLEKKKLIKGYYKEETDDRAGNRRRYYKILAAGDRALGEAQGALMGLWGVRFREAGLWGLVVDVAGVVIHTFRKNELISSSIIIISIIIISSNSSNNIISSIGSISIVISTGTLLLEMVNAIKQNSTTTKSKLSTQNSFLSNIYSQLRKKLYFLRFLLPKKYREEIVGDLIETKNALKESTQNSFLSNIYSQLRKKLYSLRFLLPKKYREEIVGDLIETKNALKEEGHGKGWIFSILLGQFLSIIYSMLRFKVGELYEKKIVGKKEEEGLEELELKPLDEVEQNGKIEREDFY